MNAQPSPAIAALSPAERLRRFLFRWVLCPLGGMPAGDWFALLRRNHFAVDPCYWPRAALITFSCVSNSLARWRENRLYGAAIEREAIEPPLFILGHYRTGTTHLHNLLSVDRRFAFPNNYQICFPGSFLTTESWGSRFGFVIPKWRLQDNVRLGLAEPQEEELAIAISCGLSPYLGMAFPRETEYYDRFFTLRDASAAEVDRWKAAYLRFLKKLSLKYARPLVLKSPPNTCRIKLLLEMFPQARFMHIHRHPFTVFQSTRRLWQTAIPGVQLQRPDAASVDAMVLRNFKTMYESFFAERSLIPPGRFHEVCFEDLERQPLEELRSLYRGLNLPDFATAEPAFHRYLASLAGYQKNEYPALADDLRERIAHDWRRYFEEWGYTPGDGSKCTVKNAQ